MVRTYRRSPGDAVYTSLGLNELPRLIWIILLPVGSIDNTITSMQAVEGLGGAIYGEASVTGEFPAQRPVTRSFDVFFDLHLNRRLNKQS